MLLPILAAVLLPSCRSDDNDLFDEKTINGTWYLKNLRGGYAPSSHDYFKGSVVWTFNQIDSTLLVENKIGNEHAFLLHSGSYKFLIEENEETRIIVVEDADYSIQVRSVDRDLFLFDGLTHGYTAEFRR
jgi:hypothetical protein